MTAVLTATLMLASWSIPTSDDVITGRATYMSPGTMEQVIANRKLTMPAGLIPVALNRRGDLYRRVWLMWADGSVDAAYSVDCAGRGDYGTREGKRLIVEVDAQTAGRHGFYALGPMPVTVIFTEPHPEPEGAI